MRVVMSGEFWVDVLKLHRLCAAAPDVREVLTADDTDEMCALAGESRDPVVSIIGAEWWARSGTALLRRLATAGGAKGGLVVVAPAPSATVVADALPECEVRGGAV